MRSPAVPAECVRRRRTAVVRRQTHRSWGCRLPVRSRQHRKRSPAIMGARGARGQLIDPAWWRCCQRKAQRGCCLAKARQPHRLQPQIAGAATTGRNFARSSLSLRGCRTRRSPAAGARIGGRDVCLLAVIVTELEDGSRFGGRAVPHSEANHQGGAAKGRIWAAAGLTVCSSSGPTSKLLSDPSMQSKLLSKPCRHRSPSHKFSSPLHTRRPRHGCGPASSGTLSSNNV